MLKVGTTDFSVGRGIVSILDYQGVRTDGLEKVKRLPAWKRAKKRIEAQDEVRIAPLRRELPKYVRCCRKQTLLQLWDKETGLEQKAIVYRCGSWRCRQCSRKLNAKWFSRIVESHKESPIEWAFTLTYRAREGLDPDPDELERSVGPAFSKVVKDLRNWLCRGPRHIKEARKEAKFCQYLKVLEWTKRAYPHIHGLLKRLPATVFSSRGRAKKNSMDNTHLWEEVPLTEELLHGKIIELAQKHGFGWIGQVERIKSAKQAASYVTSHALKAYQLRPDYIKGLRRITKSREFMAPQLKKEPVLDLIANVMVEFPVEKVWEFIELEGGSVSNIRGDVLVDEKGLPDSLAVGALDYEPAPGSLVDLRLTTHGGTITYFMRQFFKIGELPSGPS